MAVRQLIIANAGQKGNVTISTNMAGRGTDIKLGEGVKEVGGSLWSVPNVTNPDVSITSFVVVLVVGAILVVPSSIFLLKMTSCVFSLPIASQAIMGRLGMKEGEAIVSPMVTRAIEKAQKRVEEQNFSSRKHVLEYDDVMNQQRQVIYSRRRKILDGTITLDFIPDAVKGMTEGIVMRHSPELTQKPFEKKPSRRKSATNSICNC